jgi:predicted protein tyrosine phosphatase
MNKNRQHNLSNPHQGKAKKVLCLCSAGLLRSPTAANVLHRELGYNTRAAGTVKDYALIHADEALLLWADEIVCMEMSNYLYAKDAAEALDIDTGVVLLDIDDNFCFMDDDLQKQILINYTGSTPAT